ncbi:MAG TPA: SDR family NAD(P)-dependent oxidoreductase [Herpetosiphonaceae bacterium]|nr:SDR family NAD(P)-dependent oxidoreductase [Herpetosiphonaceae bacterium]
MLLKNKVALVTGAGRGIGLAAAARLAREGAAVVLADLNLDEAQQAADTLASHDLPVLPVRADVAKRDDVRAMIRAAEEHFGRLDILVNNAGIAGRAAPIEEITDDDWEAMMAIDLKSVYLCCQAAIPGMKARRYGRIVNVASIAGKEGNPNMIPYSTAKAGVIGLTKALAKEVAAFGIYVNAISPAVIETPILQQLTPEQVAYMVQRIPLGRPGRPEEVAALICWLASDEASFTTGQCIDISGGRATY